MTDVEQGVSDGIVSRAVTAGAIAGGMIGLAVGTVLFPLLGSGVGTGIGGIVGAGVGLLNGSVLTEMSQRGARRVTCAIAAGGVSGVVGFGCATLMGLLFTARPPVWLAVTTGFAVLGAALGRAVVAPDPWARRAFDLRRIAHDARRGAAVAVCLGAIAGLIVGLVAFPPTAPVALLEGAFFAVAPGALVGALAGCVAGCVAARRGHGQAPGSSLRERANPW